MRFVIGLFLLTWFTAAHAQRMQPGDICDFTGGVADPVCPPVQQMPGPWMGRRVEIMSGVAPPPYRTPECAAAITGQIMIRPAYSGERGFWVDTRAVRNCVDRHAAPETIERHRQDEAAKLAEKQRVAAAEAAQAPIDAHGGQLIHPPPELANGLLWQLHRRQYVCPELREVYQTAQYRLRLRCATPGGPPMPYSILVHVNFTGANQEFHVLRIIKH